jgi:tRNA threonylcarbamoyl adenosine modification protein YeaZ
MRVLAIDTALDACAVCVFNSEGGKALASESLAMARGHAEALMPLIARVMDKSDIGFSDLDRIAVTVGPGSFTGLRVGISAARGIALASGKPAVGVTTLAVYAAPHIASEDGAQIVVAIDAKHGNVYAQVFGNSGRTIVAPQVTAVADVVRAAREAQVRIVGSGAPLVAAGWPAGDPPPLLVDPTGAPPIEWVARLGAAARKTDVPPKPLYLRAPDARPQDDARLPRR